MNGGRRFLAAALLALIAGSTLAAAPAPRVALHGVTIEGIDTGDGGGAAFLGIPFAEPPVGARRWTAPSAWQPRSTTLDATRFAPGCLQDERMVGWYRDLVRAFDGDPASVPAPSFSEDCLYLNVWRPGASKAPLPVLVWIHGGSNKGGWSSEPNYAGKKLAREGLVVVSIAYRLGVFGFMSLPGLPESNFALQDQIAALRWVKQNIAAFGGDASGVTVAGESSGANNIAYLLASPAARGLFHRAIMQSGASVLNDRGSREEALARGTSLAAALGQTGRTPSLDALRAVDGKSLLAAAATVYAGHYFDPVVDGVTVTEPLPQSVQKGQLAPVPLLIGTNADEWRMYLEQPLDEAGWLRKNAPGRETAVRAALATDQDPARRIDRLETARNFTCNSLRLAGALARGGQRAWVYHFSRVREGIGGERLRAYHGAEIPYVFGTHDAWLPTDPKDLALSGAMMGYWGRFARAGDPNGESAPRWPQWSADRPQAMALGNTVGAATHPELSLCTALMPDSGPR